MEKWPLISRDQETSEKLDSLSLPINMSSPIPMVCFENIRETFFIIRNGSER